MKFARHSKPFRGLLDPVPVVSGFFILLVFVLLSALVYTPGIPFRLTDVSAARGHLLTLTKEDELVFQGQTNAPDDLTPLLEAFKKLPAPALVMVQAANESTQREIITRVRDQARELQVTVELLGGSLQLPEGTNLVGTANPSVAVAVTLGGQLFYENRRVSEADLKPLLEAAVKAHSGALTLLILADKSAPNDIILRLGQMAEQVKIRDVLLAGRSTTP